MKIGFDISQTGNNKAGCGYFADSLILALTGMDHENQYLLYPHFGTGFFDPEAEKTARNISLTNVSRIIIGKEPSEVLKFWSNLSLGDENIVGSPDVVHANNYSCPKFSRAKVVYTLHDLNFLRFPQFSTEHNRRVCFNGVFDSAVYSDFIISISNYSRERYLELFPNYPPDRIKVVHPGNRIKREFLKNNGSGALIGLQPERYWLSVGILEPRKNLRRMLKAYSDFKKEADNDFPLVLAGGKGWLEDDLEAHISGLNLSSDVKILGYVSDEDLAWLYKNCFAFLYPSCYEGFGMPVLEAMAMGAAVIASGTTSLPEVGGNAACYVDPFDTRSITEAFIRLSESPEYRFELQRLSIKQACKFSWEKSAEEVLEVYEKIFLLPKR
jgi:glycosyltransferase involved in cell wall biosynthesis